MDIDAIKQYMRGISPFLLIAVAFGFSVATTWDLNWPPRWDFYRELGAINTILDGHRGSDPLYFGESNWYNPLVPEIVAFLSQFFSLGTPAFFTRIGPYLNLLTPVAFYLFVRLIIPKFQAVAALAIFLFWVPQNIPENTAGLYSPWLWPRNFAIGLFFLSAYFFLIAVESKQFIWSGITGLFLGLSFLAHTAPALIVSVSITAFCVQQQLFGKNKERNRYFLKLFLIGAISFLVSSSFLIPLFLAYKFNIINSAPSDHLGIKPPDVLMGTFTFRFLFAALGFYFFIDKKKYRENNQEQFLLILFVTTACFFIYGMLFWHLQKYDIRLTQIVPAYHFHMYLKCFEAIFAAFGIFFLSELAIKRVKCTSVGGKVYNFICRNSAAALTVVIFILIISALPNYRQSDDLYLFRQEALERENAQHLNHFYDWARKSTNWDDVFLADDEYSIFAVSPAARKIVATYDIYSNPYVDYDDRYQARLVMFEALRSENYQKFMTLAKKYKVAYVIDAEDAGEKYRLKKPLPEHLFKSVFSMKPMVVYRVVNIFNGNAL